VPPWNLDSVTRPTIRFGRVTRKVQFLTHRVGRLLTHPQKATSARPCRAIPVNPRTCSGRVAKTARGAGRAGIAMAEAAVPPG
jgi:hypothetical protein